MIFVKETRPTIVNQHPELGALDIMKKVGELWQLLLSKKDGTKYFQDKADIDKKRYLKEQMDFYDEVERIHRDAKADKEDSVQEVQIPNYKNVVPENDDKERKNALV